MVKHLPFPSACIAHVLSLLFLPLAVLPFALNLDPAALWLPLGAIAFLWLSDLAAFVLSLTVGWNVPIRISYEGITGRDGLIHHWCDAVGLSTKKGMPTRYGRFYSVVLRYSDGSSIRFELSLPIIKSIQTHCSNKTFLAKLNDCFE